MFSQYKAFGHTLTNTLTDVTDATHINAKAFTKIQQNKLIQQVLNSEVNDGVSTVCGFLPFMDQRARDFSLGCFVLRYVTEKQVAHNQLLKLKYYFHLFLM